MLRCGIGISSRGCDHARVILDSGSSVQDGAYIGNWIYIFSSGGSTRLHQIVRYDGAFSVAWLKPAEGSGAAAGSTAPAPWPLSTYVILSAPARPEGVRLAVGGDMLVDAWLHFLSPVGGGPAAARWLSGGQTADLALEYRSLAGSNPSAGGGARVVLQWSSSSATGGAFQTVPSQRLYFSPSTLAFPLTLF